ncbi:MAG: KH domain-containing protein [Candidatus Neomarinimicrobiota bacterium]|nr:KH domain-containing protein [Candidatus Neomarinimicrobiota bacterium]MDD3716362.1 KH domain-containing protein [Candidatus Neomarinimicrobiota bacterium]MDD3965426.1 KH domain-containing protein [Candidatus Neomarinimicrobiota bacterium]MDD4962072.1 KH domain-containing protein [Candidatus Neomarinimicrobiota bacterium]MDD5710381.1 KH domain-containing protein [Candidatus Neomarinimicrobiota bacterium]
MMKEFVESIVKRLVDNPDAVEVTKVESENNTIYELRVAQEDLGKVIGKHGRTAQALRTLLTAVSAKAGNTRSTLDIIDR